MVQDRVTERNASRTIENATHPRATMGAKRMPIDGDRHEAWINRESVGPGSPLAEDNVYTLTPDMDPSSVERMTGIRPSTWPEDWPVHGVFVAMLFGAIFWMGAGISSLIWWLAA